ncbi:PREDICTED: uncharacterized protein LOC108754243 isoform X2 [Trachymyrmex septentrionalis]|uniref:uncharacterized protein LOC108754243 isoform X2 n=1 Tax=Trachymyrmex septentrionalis TaxID=34720 RepID=UPI00084F5F63|nr:PREDICTED: uncharacterized protein LOC108754243 isoform X2 [Trachymyrmex septentrionalis]
MHICIKNYKTIKMVRKYKRKSSKGTYKETDMKKAIELVAKGGSIRKVADRCGVKRETLRRKIKIIKSGMEFELTSNYSHQKVFTDVQENSIADYLKMYCKMFYGLTTKDCRKLAYETAVANEIKCPASWVEKKIAGEDWLLGFFKRHPNLSLRSPEGCSLARATAFNRHNVEAFFDNYQTLLKKEPRLGDPSRIYNLDETKTTTVQNSGEIIAEKDSKAVCKVTSTAKGVLVTICCIIRADGNYLPPILIFPRVNFRDHMMIGAPYNSLGLATPSGWMNTQLFVQTMQHFIKFSYSTKDNPSLLIYDNHESHISLDVFELAKANGVHILTLPLHSTHRMQPLDVGLYNPFQKFYNTAIDSWMISHPGKTISIYEIAGFVGTALPSAMTPNSIINAFKNTGIFPYNSHAFRDDDFLPSLVSERPNVIALENLDENSIDNVSEEDERMELSPVQAVQLRVKNYVDMVKEFSDVEFKREFRISRVVFTYLLNLIQPNLEKPTGSGRCPIYPYLQLLVTLWTMATPDSYRSVCHRFNIGRATAWRAHRKVCAAIYSLADKFIKWPNIEEAQQTWTDVQYKHKFPKVLGAIDDTHIRIQKPKEHAENYINRNGHYSIHLQAVCDSTLKFIHCYAEQPGSMHDMCVFWLSDIPSMYTEKFFPHNSHLIGDAGYALQKHVMVPYDNNDNDLSEAQINFNERLCSAHVMIKEAIGYLKGRFRSLEDKLYMKRMDLIPEYIIACCVLHNICILHGDFLDDIVITEQDNNPMAKDYIETNTLGKEEGIEKRNALTNMLYESVKFNIFDNIAIEHSYARRSVPFSL